MIKYMTVSTNNITSKKELHEHVKILVATKVKFK